MRMESALMMVMIEEEEEESDRAGSGFAYTLTGYLNPVPILMPRITFWKHLHRGFLAFLFPQVHQRVRTC